MKSRTAIKSFFFLLIFVCISTTSYAQKSANIFLGLSYPKVGNEAVKGISLEQLNKWITEHLEPTIKGVDLGFNLADSIGYYKGDFERSKILTIIFQKEQEHLLYVVNDIAKSYVTEFKQDSVLTVINNNITVDFIKANPRRRPLISK